MSTFIGKIMGGSFRRSSRALEKLCSFKNYDCHHNCFTSKSIRNISLCSASIRSKYTQNVGVKGIRSRKSIREARSGVSYDDDDDNEEDKKTDKLDVDLEDRDYEEIVSEAMHVTRDWTTRKNVFIIQPYVKWGPKKNLEVSPDDQLKEAEALVRSLPNWNIVESVKVPLESLERKLLFGTGKIEELKGIVRKLANQQDNALNCIFISTGSLTFAQTRLLEAEFQMPVMDRYSVVIQILRLHATSAEARIQVAMAEIPYIWTKTKEANPSMARKQGYSLTDTQREILKTRERKLRQELERIRGQRKLLRNKRKQKNYPVVAVVGYTNCGKTSLIKALTSEETMQPRDQLFATLDVTAHAGILPCNLEVIYMDTVGFMSDIPTGLIECFVATLEDAMLADVVVHVQDLSHVCFEAQRRHVEKTLASLSQNLLDKDALPPIINVGNKIDLVPDTAMENLRSSGNFNSHLVSAKEEIGLHNLLEEIETKILEVTARRKLTMRVRNGGQEMSWIYKNAAVVDVQADESNSEMLLMNIVITNIALEQFKRTFFNK